MKWAHLARMPPKHLGIAFSAIFVRLIGLILTPVTLMALKIELVCAKEVYAQVDVVDHPSPPIRAGASFVLVQIGILQTTRAIQ